MVIVDNTKGYPQSSVSLPNQGRYLLSSPEIESCPERVHASKGEVIRLGSKTMAVPGSFGTDVAEALSTTTGVGPLALESPSSPCRDLAETREQGVRQRLRSEAETGERGAGLPGDAGGGRIPKIVRHGIRDLGGLPR